MTKKTKIELIKTIVSFMNELNIEEMDILDFYHVEPPVLAKVPGNPYAHFVLDAIRLEDGHLSFDGSDDCASERTWTEDTITRNALDAIIKFLNFYEDYIRTHISRSKAIKKAKNTDKISRLQRFRKELLDEIKSTLEKHNLEELYISDIDEGCSPIIDEDKWEEDNTYTLDSITLTDGRLSFDGSNCFSNYSWSETTISTDALIGIVDFLDNHAEKIKELASTDDED